MKDKYSSENGWKGDADGSQGPTGNGGFKAEPGRLSLIYRSELPLGLPHTDLSCTEKAPPVQVLCNFLNCLLPCPVTSCSGKSHNVLHKDTPMPNYEIQIQVTIRETDEDVSQAAQQSVDGSFRTVVSGASGQTIEACEQAV